MKDYHFFWQADSPFSQWHRSTFELNGYVYTTAEQGMMHGKALLFEDDETATKILATDDPRTIKALGRQVTGFNEHVWEQHREKIVYQNNLAKFKQNENLTNVLLSTTGMFVEASPYDRIWGIGLHERDARKIPAYKWKGLNLLGKILTQVREDIRSEEKERKNESQDNDRTEVPDEELEE